MGSFSTIGDGVGAHPTPEINYPLVVTITLLLRIQLAQ